MKHAISRISFEPGADDGPAACYCGWEGQASEFALHRRTEGGTHGGKLTTPEMFRGERPLFRTKAVLW